MSAGPDRSFRIFSTVKVHHHLQPSYLRAESQLKLSSAPLPFPIGFIRSFLTHPQQQQVRELSQGHILSRAKKLKVRDEDLKLPPITGFAYCSSSISLAKLFSVENDQVPSL